MRPTWCCGRCPETTSGGVDCTCAGNPRCKGPLCACGHSALDHHGVDGRVRRDAGCLGDESREGWCRCPQTATSVAIAAHEAEVVGQILDLIDKLHYPANRDLDRTPICTQCHGKAGTHPCGCWQDTDLYPICGECGEQDVLYEWADYPCPTRRLTAEIRGELSHD